MTTTFTPAEQSELFRLMRRGFRLDSAQMPLITKPQSPPLPPSASAAEVIGAVARRQYSLRALVADTATAALFQCLTKREVFQIHYVPFVIAEVIWDSIDSLIELSKGLTELKAMARSVRRLREIYVKTFPARVRPSLDDGELRANGEIFEQEISRPWGIMTIALRAEIKTQFPELDDYQGVDILQVAWQIRILMKALNRFIHKTLGKIKKLTAIDLEVTDILPDPYWRLHEIICGYTSPMKPESSRFKVDQWADVLATQMGLIEL